MKVDYLIKNGRVVDPFRNIDRVQDVAILNHRITESDNELIECEHIIDAKGCLVTPGLVDFHTHLFFGGSTIAIRPDLMVCQGTTSAVDAGTSGTANYEAFYNTTVIPSAVRIKSFLNVYSGGQLDPKLCEDFNPALYNIDKMERLIDRYRHNILGLKIRLSTGVVPQDKGSDYLKTVVDLAERLNNKLGTSLRVCVHTTNSPISAGSLAGLLRPGDIFCHCFQGGKNHLIMEDGSIDPGILDARRRGVLFDAANGKGNFGLATAKQALAQGFLPDIISSDLTNDKFNMPPYAKNLPTIMSKYLTLGMNFMDIIRAVTAIPAGIMEMKGEIGTLLPGAAADIAVFKLKKVKITHKDWKNDELEGNVLLVPLMTICAGEIQYCANDFWI